jgi:hypothetical protein
MPVPRICVRGCDRLGVDVAVVITDTMGRAWRNGQTDVAIGSAGLPVLYGYAGSTDTHGNELVVTEIAVADEVAAAADLVKGKLTAIPVAVVRGLEFDDDGSTGQRLVRAGEDDLFWLGTAEASSWAVAGPAVAALGAAVLRRAGRSGGCRGRGRRGVDGTRAASHPAGAVRLAARCRAAGGVARGAPRALAFRSPR